MNAILGSVQGQFFGGIIVVPCPTPLPPHLYRCMKRLAPTSTRWHTSELGSVCGMLCKRRSVDPQTRRLFLSHSTGLSCLPSLWHLTEVQFHFPPHHIHHHVTALKILMKTFSNHCRSLNAEKEKNNLAQDCYFCCVWENHNMLL